jgi:hypothetical protein
MPLNSAPVDPKSAVDEYTGPVAGYELVESKPVAPDDRFIASTIDATPEVAHAVAEARARYAAALLAPAEAVAEDQEDEEEERTPSETLKTNTTLVIGVGVVAFLVFLLTFLLHGKVEASGDMGTVTENTSGLKGHLTTNWGDRLNYKLTLEPADSAQAAAFANAVYHSARPLWVGVQLKDPTGEVLCGSTILLKYDPLQNSAAAISAPAATEADASGPNQIDVAQALNNARLESQEIAREHGKDLFENVNGPDGQVASIAAQGTLPCTKKQYDGTASWALLSNFPVPGANTPGTDSDRAAADEAQARSARADEKASLARKRKSAPQVSNFSIEEDDEIVGFRPAAGTIETVAGKTFRVERKDSTMSALKGMDLPVRIHYRCDQFGTCTLAGVGASVQHAWMER